VAVSETKSIARIARRTVLSNNALSVLVSILEETPGGMPKDTSRSVKWSIFESLRKWHEEKTDF
jgi:hypothetical protein